MRLRAERQVAADYYTQQQHAVVPRGPAAALHSATGTLTVHFVLQQESSESAQVRSGNTPEARREY